MLSWDEHEKSIITWGPGLDEDKDYRFKLQTYKTWKKNELEGRNDLIYKQFEMLQKSQG